MDQYSPIYINIPCPTTEEAQKICTELLTQDLCGTAKIYPKVELFFKKDEVDSEIVCIINLKTTNINLPKIHEYILKNHSWGTPCIEVLPLQTDLC
jgi:uncharacterized protein involved in tolerance to divalent cations